VSAERIVFSGKGYEIKQKNSGPTTAEVAAVLTVPFAQKAEYEAAKTAANTKVHELYKGKWDLVDVKYTGNGRVKNVRENIKMFLLKRKAAAPNSKKASRNGGW
jgi:hypothetical protein